MKVSRVLAGITASVIALSMPFLPALAQTATSTTDSSLIDNSPDDVTPPGNVTDFTAAGLDSQVVLSWTNPADSDFVRTLIIRKTGSAPASKDDGTAIFEGENTNFTDTQLTNGTTYYYTAYTFDNVPNYSSGVTVSSSPQAGKTQIDFLGLPQPAASTAGAAGLKLIIDNGTFYLVQSGTRSGVTSPGILYSYGFEFKDGRPATAADLALPLNPLLLPNSGALVKSKEDPTVYLVSNSHRYGFTSAAVFIGLGFKWQSVLTVTNPELQALPKAADLSDPSAAHLPGLDINKNGTIYWIGMNNVLHAYPSQGVYNSWWIDNDYSHVVPANAADAAMPIGSVVSGRVIE